MTEYSCLRYRDAGIVALTLLKQYLTAGRRVYVEIELETLMYAQHSPGKHFAAAASDDVP